MRKALLAAAIAGLLVAAYAAAGHWLAPRFVRDALIEHASRLGLELRIAEVRTDPFAFSVALSGIELSGPGGGKLASAQRASAELAWASLWGPAWVVQRASVYQPVLAVTLGPQGEIHWPTPPAAQDGTTAKKLLLREFVLSDGRLEFIDRSRGAPVALTLEALGVDLHELSTQSGAPARYELAARIAGGGTLSSQGSISLAPLGARGKLAVNAAPVPLVWQLAAPGAATAHGELHASATYAYDAGRLLLQEVALEVARFSYAGLQLPQLTLHAPELAVPSDQSFEVSGKASVQPGGSIAARGTLRPRPLTADLHLDIARLALVHAQPWLPEHVSVKIASGTLSANGRLRFAEKDAGFQGAVALHDVRLDEADSRNLLLGWQRLETGEAKLRFAPFSAEIGEMVVRAPKGRLVIASDGSVNFIEAIRNPQDGDGDKKRAHVTVRRLRIANGTLDFADRSLDPAFAVNIRELSGAVTGLSTAPSDPARVQLEGRVQKYGSARIRGTIDLAAPKERASISARFRNLDMAALTPYAAKFAGYRIESGRLSADLRYRLRDGNLSGENQLVMERLKLGEKVESPTAPDLPLELAIALLSDAEGRINMAIPVRGDLNDPQVDLGGLVAKAIGSAVSKIVSAPFRALGALLGGGGQGAAEVRFEPGSVKLGPPQEESIAQVAKALAERPKLELVIRGGYDPEADATALRQQTVRRELARRAGYSPKDVEQPGAFDLADPKVLQAAENLFLQRAGSLLELIRLRADERRYRRLLFDKLAAATPVEPGTAQTLANARAETVRAALLQHGVDAARLRLEAPIASPAENGGVPTSLSLEVSDRDRLAAR